MYVSLPLINNKDFYKELRNIVSSHVPVVSLNLLCINKMTIRSSFNVKEKLDPLMTSGVIYLFNCPRCDLGKYVGSTRRLLKVRIDSHKGVSYRTGIKLSNPEFSSIRDHAKKCKYNIEYKDFKIIGKTQNEKELPILESLFIKQVVPQLNAQTSSIPLYLS